MIKKIAAETIYLIRQRKRDGLSITKIAKEFKLSTSTVSLYCRDLFNNPSRKYKTEEEARHKISLYKSERWHDGKRSPSDLITNRPSKHKHLPCIKCGQLRKADSVTKLCYPCYKQKRIDDANTHKQQKSSVKSNQPQLDNKTKQTEYKKVRVEICNKSPNKRHYFIIGSQSHNHNIGICKWCKLVRDYNKLQPTFNKTGNFGTI